MGMQAKQAGDALWLDANGRRHWSMTSRPALKTSQTSCSLVVRIAHFGEQRALCPPKIPTVSSFFFRQSFTLSLPIPFLFRPLFAVSSSLEPPFSVPLRSNKLLHWLYPRLDIFVQNYVSEYFQFIHSKKCGRCLESKGDAWRTYSAVMSRAFPPWQTTYYRIWRKVRKVFSSNPGHVTSYLVRDFSYAYPQSPQTNADVHIQTCRYWLLPVMLPWTTRYHFPVMFSFMYFLHLKEWNINPLNPELNPICYLLALLGAHNFLHVSRMRVKLLTFRLLMSYIYGAPILDVSRSHTTTQHSR